MVLPQGHRGNFQPVMTAPKGFRFKTACYTIEGLNSFAHGDLFQLPLLFHADTVRFQRQGKTSLLAALIGLIYTFASWQAGRVRAALRLFHRAQIRLRPDGSSGWPSARSSHSVAGQIRRRLRRQRRHVLHLADDRGARQRRRNARRRAARRRHLQHHLGGDQRRWRFSSAARSSKSSASKAFFICRSRSWSCNSRLVFWLENHATELARLAVNKPPAAPPPPDPNRPSPARAKTFLRMAWLANPFAYIAINTLHRRHAGHRRANSSSRRCSPDSSARSGVSCGWARSSCCGAGRAGITGSAGW